jgi:hypothetical protein
MLGQSPARGWIKKCVSQYIRLLIVWEGSESFFSEGTVVVAAVVWAFLVIVRGLHHHFPDHL